MNEMQRTCQINHIDSIAQPQNAKLKLQSKIISILQLTVHILKKGIINSIEHLIKNWESPQTQVSSRKENANIDVLHLRPGDHVKVKSKKEIFDTLDKDHRFEGCAFMDEMAQYCGTEQIVYRKINNFFDERLCKFFKAKGIVLLEGITCSGKLSIAGPVCDRSCYLFWKEAWLEKIES